MVMSKRTSWVGHAAHIGALRKAYSSGFRKLYSRYTSTYESGDGNTRVCCTVHTAQFSLRTSSPPSFCSLLFFNGLVFSFRPHRSSATRRNQPNFLSLKGHTNKRIPPRQKDYKVCWAQRMALLQYSLSSGRHSCHESDFHINKQTVTLMTLQTSQNTGTKLSGPPIIQTQR